MNCRKLPLHAIGDPMDDRSNRRSAHAQTAPGEQVKLEQDFTDPFTTLPQVLIRDSYTPANYGPCTRLTCVRNAETHQLIVASLTSRIPLRTLLPSTN